MTNAMPRGPLEVPADKYPKPGTFRHGLGIRLIWLSSRVWISGLRPLTWATRLSIYANTDQPRLFRPTAGLLSRVLLPLSGWSMDVSEWISHAKEHVFGYCYTNRPR